MEYAIETLSLTKVFSDWWGRSKVYAVDNLNLKIAANEVFGLLGPNGSGKTTTIKMLLGLLHPTKGRAVVLGGDGTDPKISARVGFLPEESYLYRYLTARETLDFYGRLFGLERQVRKMRIESLLDMVGLKAVANRAVGTFSKGMARRIGLAQALINDPELLILDEPTTGLDPIGTRQIKDLIIELGRRGKTVLLCSHLLADVEDVCDRISILYGGRIQAEGKVGQLLRQTDRRQILTDAISDGAVEKIRAIVRGENAECEVTSPMDKLENFFIRTVSAAQEKSQPTSGAVSTTKIGDFLAEKRSTSRDLLDKLVSSGASEQPAVGSTKTEKVTPEEDAGPAVNDALLGRLSAADGVEPVSDARETETTAVPVEQGGNDRVSKSILDELVGRRKSDDHESEQADPSQPGEKGDA